MIEAQVIPTPAGALSLLARGEVVVAAGFTADPTELFARLSPAVRAGGLAPSGDLGPVAHAVRDYLGGDLAALDAVPVERQGSPTRQRLHAALRDVPAGTTVTYAELAERAGLSRGSARVAASACSQNLIVPFVPCHRVLPASGGAGGYYYGTPVKEWLLAHEARVTSPTA
ncbi:putative methylated-DNA:protein-cysteine methyltransferase [Microtetraspora sp. NBRC 13810]|uniref:methylated-DNA--[protein]-cysteine S-methyltransferase n=1 Tax=Microtetraspora sp. NBRC 13810 TaxID=3030990 RepID=UPI0024A2DE58|nr:methylated-DNA--[protein]-cysteine S-methyltransferase [Microtetraspora sp. NBRC 13810]GLW05440.1 putative methylated-DNA:protein-cysteine methyltransferase [Microtetraspora sp. NBRC 13810]